MDIIRTGSRIDKRLIPSNRTRGKRQQMCGSRPEGWLADGQESEKRCNLSGNWNEMKKTF